MVWEVLLNGVLGLVDGLLGQLPDPGVVIESGGLFILGYQALNTALPLDTMILCFGLTLSIIGSLFPFLMTTYIYRLVPFKGT